MYKRGTLPVLPHADLDPDLVRQAMRIAQSLLNDPIKFAKGSGYALETIRTFNRRAFGSERLRSDILRYSREIAQEHKQTFFDLASVEPIDIPESVFPYRIVSTRSVPAGFERNRSNPYDRLRPDGVIPNLYHYLWSALYLSVRPGNSPHVHLFGDPLRYSRAYMDQIHKNEQGFLETFLSGPRGTINQNSVIANPTLLSHFAAIMGVPYNIWGNSLVTEQEDLDAPSA